MHHDAFFYPRQSWLGRVSLHVCAASDWRRLLSVAIHRLLNAGALGQLRCPILSLG